MRLVPRVKAMRIEESWQIPGMRVRCVAHLTRPLSSSEARLMEASSRFRASGETVVFYCRPEDTEEWSSRLVLELGRAAGLDRDRFHQ